MFGLCSRRAFSGREHPECSPRHQPEGQYSQSVSRRRQSGSCKLRRDAYTAGGGSVAGDTGLISNAFDEELSAISLEEEFAALDGCQMRRFVSKQLVSMSAYLDNDWIQGGRRACEKHRCCRQQRQQGVRFAHHRDQCCGIVRRENE
jgi:hypothetical protein